MTTGLAGSLEPIAASNAAPKRGLAVAVAAVRGTETALLCRGPTDRRMPAAVIGAETRFELGSVTKTFTALLLAEMAARGEVSCEDPISAYLPAGAVPPGRHGKRITLRHLATHTAGLPRLPPGLLRTALPTWYTNPYDGFTPAQLLHSLSRTRIRHCPGIRVHYSNYGVGLLGHVLATAAGTDYADALATRVLRPLGLADTTCDPTLPQATGHWHRRPRPPWRIPALAGAAALRSSARDLLRYLQAHLFPHRNIDLSTALDEVARPRPIAPRGDPLCLVWNRREIDGRDLLFHTGGTRGFTTFIGFSRQTRVGLAALTNTTPTLRNDFIQTAYLVLRALVLEQAPESSRATVSGLQHC